MKAAIAPIGSIVRPGQLVGGHDLVPGAELLRDPAGILELGRGERGRAPGGRQNAPGSQRFQGQGQEHGAVDTAGKCHDGAPAIRQPAERCFLTPNS